MEPPSPQLLTNSSAPATRRLIKAMHLFMTELIKQGKRWSPLWKHISPGGNCLWSRIPRAVSGHRFWIFVTYEETVRFNAFKKIISEARRVMEQDVLQGIFEAAWTGPVITSIGHWPEGWKETLLPGLCFVFLLSSGVSANCFVLKAFLLIRNDNCYTMITEELLEVIITRMNTKYPHS